MKVTEETEDRLLIEDRPLFLWVMLFGLGFVSLISALTGRVDGLMETVLVASLGAGMLWVGWRFEPYQAFEFNRDTGIFTHKMQRLTGSETWTRPIAEIRRATDEGNWDDGTRSHRVTLLTENGAYPLESGFTSLDRRATIDAINRWLGAES